MDACERVGCCYHPGSGRCTFALDLVTPAAINHSAALRPVYIKNAEAMLSSALSPSNPVQVAFVLVQTGAVRESKADSQAVRLIHSIRKYFCRDEILVQTHVVLFTAKSMPLVPPFVKVLSLTNIAPDGILPASLLAQHENAFAEFDFVFSISPELAFVADVCWDMLGHRVAVHDPLMYSVCLVEHYCSVLDAHLGPRSHLPVLRSILVLHLLRSFQRIVRLPHTAACCLAGLARNSSTWYELWPSAWRSTVSVRSRLCSCALVCPMLLSTDS
jgi:hypothetical protein